MTFKVEKGEQEAWDSFAGTVLRGLINSRPISGDEAAKIAAGFADEMIKQRRERVQGRPEVPNISKG